MSSNSVIYANAIVSANISKMLTADKYQRLLDCENIFDAEKYLQELGLEGKNVDEMFTNATDAIYAFLSKEAPIEQIKKAFLKKNDYHNAKVFMKCKYMRKEPQASILYLNSMEDTVKMKDWILADDYSFLPIPMAKALEKIDYAFAQGDRRSKFIDCTLTQAMYEDILSITIKYSSLYNFFRKEIDIANLSSAFRVFSNHLPQTAYEEEYMIGGNLLKEPLLKLAEGESDSIQTSLSENSLTFVLPLFAERKEIDLESFEKLSDDYFIEYFKQYKFDTTSYLLFYGYIYARLMELKNIRIICSGIRAKSDKIAVKAKLRLLYV